MSESSVEPGSAIRAEPSADVESVPPSTAPAMPRAATATDGGGNTTARWQFWALVGGSAVLTIAVAIIPAFDDFWGDDGWSYQTLVDGRARFVIATLLAPMAFLVLVAGLPLLRRYAPVRGRALVTTGLALLAVGSALFALAIASQMSLGVAARGQLDPAVGEAFVDLFQDADAAWEVEPWFIGGFFLGAIGWILFVIGARRARTITTPLLVVLLVIGLAWNFLPPGWALAVASAAMTAVFAWLGSRVLRGPAPTMVTPASSP